MASPPSAYDNPTFKLLPNFHSLFSQKLALDESPSTLPNVTYNLYEVRTSIFVSLTGLMLFFLFYQMLDRFHNWLRNEEFEDDIELGDMANHHHLHHGYLTDVSDWSHEATMQNNLWLMEIFNGLMAFLADRQGINPEDLETVLPLVNYKSLGKTLDECAICLEEFEDDELCRVFPVCKHVFHFNCIDHWLRNHMTCPICRNRIMYDNQTM